MSASSNFSAPSFPSPFLPGEGGTDKSCERCQRCVYPSSSMAWELLCRCRRGWQGGRVMILPAHLCPHLGTRCFSLPFPRTCHSQELPPLLGGDHNPPTSDLSSHTGAQCQVFSCPWLSLSQAEGLLIPEMTWSDFCPWVLTAIPDPWCLFSQLLPMFWASALAFYDLC